jgi:hypothetical protein
MRILVQMEGVVRSLDDDPIPTGIIMTGTLTVHNQLTFMTNLSEDKAKTWLNINKVVDYDHLIDSSASLVYEELSERQINLSRAKGGIDLFITSDPKLWAYAFDKGIPSAMFGSPSHLPPENRYDAPKRLRSWNDIETSIERQNEFRTEAARAKKTEALNFQ